MCPGQGLRFTEPQLSSSVKGARVPWPAGADVPAMALVTVRDPADAVSLPGPFSMPVRVREGGWMPGGDTVRAPVHVPAPFQNGPVVTMTA